MKKDFTRNDYELYLNKYDFDNNNNGTFVRNNYPKNFEKNYQDFLKNTVKYRTEEI